MHLQTRDGNAYFEKLAEAFFCAHPEIPHARREIPSLLAGGATVLACHPGSPREVSASLTSHQISITAAAEQRDFEDFGRGLSQEQVAAEAFEYFASLALSGP
jgi:hypothetical protein